MRMFSLEIRTLEKVTSKAALRTLTSIQDGPEYEKAQIMRFQEKWNDMSDRWKRIYKDTGLRVRREGWVKAMHENFLTSLC